MSSLCTAPRVERSYVQVGLLTANGEYVRPRTPAIEGDRPRPTEPSLLDAFTKGAGFKIRVGSDGNRTRITWFAEAVNDALSDGYIKVTDEVMSDSIEVSGPMAGALAKSLSSALVVDING